MAGVKIPEGCRVNALEKAALARAFFDIIKFIELSKKEKNTNAVAQYGQAKDLCAHFWNIENIYLFPKIKKTEYEYFFKGALDARIVISPYFDIPSIFPNIKVYSELINFLQTKIN